MAWPHDNVLGGVTRQRLTYDQLSLTQFIQGFTRNILDESDGKVREQMLWYMSDLMEDATDFSWASAKAAHAVLLCEMERGTVCWADTGHIDRIRRAHAQKHNHFTKQNCMAAKIFSASATPYVTHYVAMVTASPTI